jgi:hypothetical protein
MQQTYAFILLFYLMIGIGVSTRMSPHEEYPNVAYVIRAATWPFVAGLTIEEHRQLVIDTRRILHKAAELKGQSDD